MGRSRFGIPGGLFCWEWNHQKLGKLKRSFDLYSRAPGVQRDYDLKTPVTDVIIHPNQGEIISSDQSGVVRIWDLGENACTHELVPEEDVPVKSVSMAGDGGILVAANNKVGRRNVLFVPVVS
jgi:WD40 repeat protein